MEFDATFFIAAISFTVFVFIMNRILYAPVMKIMQKRSDYAEENFRTAEKLNAETKEKEECHAKKLEASRTEVRSLIETETRRMNSEKSRIIADYKTELQHKAEEEKKNLRKSAFAARETLKDSAADIAAEISNILLGGSISTEAVKHRQTEGEES